MSDYFGHPPAMIDLGPITGYAFTAEWVEVPCFVPGHLVTFGSDGAVAVDHLGYFLTGWSVRNLRWSDSSTGRTHLFPDARRLIDCETLGDLAVQLERWRRLANAGAGSLR